MSQRKIFLSYRRDDIPGYVARLEDDLERVFGKDRVFRDVEDIVGGSEWKVAIEQNLRASAVLLLVIGKDWASIWESRKADPVNYVVLELERARKLGIPVIPVFIQGANLPPELDLGPISWLRERQFYEISDTQKRWDHDLDGLVEIIQQTTGLEAPGKRDGVTEESADTSSMLKTLFWGTGAAIVLVLGIWWAMTGDNGAEFNDEFTPTEPTVPTLPDSSTQSGVADPAEIEAQDESFPNINGKWINPKNNHRYMIRQLENGRLRIYGEDIGEGRGRFIPRMPRKFSLKLQGGGDGEFAVSNTGESISGWFRKSGKHRQEYARLIILQPR